MKPKEDIRLYRPVLAEAGRFAWRHKNLWIFGLFAAFIMSGGVYDVVARSWSGALAKKTALALPYEFSVPDLEAVLRAGAGNVTLALPPALWLALIVAAFLLAAGIWLAVTAQGALVWSARIWKTRAPTVKSSWRAGLAHFWPILAVDAASKLLIFLVVAATALPAGKLLLAHVSTQAFGIYLAAFLVAIPLALTIMLLAIFTVAGIVIHEEGLMRSVRRAWQTFRAHWIVSLEMAAIVLLIDFLVALGMVFVFFLLAVPFTLALGAVKLYGSAAAFAVVITLAVVVVLGAVAVIGSALTTFRYAAWTRLYLRLESPGVSAKIIRVARATARWVHSR